MLYKDFRRYSTKKIQPYFQCSQQKYLIVKKQITLQKFREYNDRRSANRCKRDATHSSRLARRTRSINRKRKQIEKRVTVTAPDHFSFINNPDAVCEFVNELEKLFERQTSVFVNLSNVTSMDHSAVILMMAVLVQFKSQKIHFNGNYPTKSDLSRSIRKVVGTLYSKSFNKQDEYTIHVSKEYKIYTHARKTVDSVLTGNLIGSCAELIWGDRRRCQGVQSSLIELMHNTNNHADPIEHGKKHWWLSISYDENTNSASYVFVDFGIGIIESLNSKPAGNKWSAGWKALKSLWNSDAALLEKILAGDLHKTVTGLSFRGKGLPHIAAASDRNHHEKLCVISNKAYCNYGSGVVKVLDRSFSGTLVHWEVNYDNHNC